MGLDQYAYTKKSAKHKKQTKLAYWRKHNRLHGWMFKLWAERGNTGEFNCVEMELKPADIDALEVAVNDKTMPETSGFFFGSDSYQEYDKWYKNDDLEFIRLARHAFAEKEKVFYNSWW